MGIAWDDTNKVLHSNVQLHEPADGVIEPVEARFAGMLCSSRRLNPHVLAQMRALVTANVPEKYWIQDGTDVREMTAPEKAVQDAKPPPTPTPDPPDPT